MSYLKSNTLFEQIRTEDLYQHVPRPLLIADHLLTPDNIGAMIRLADNIGASEMCFLGNEDEHRLGKVRRAAASSRDNIRWYFTEETDLHKFALSAVSMATTPPAFMTHNCLKMWLSWWVVSVTASVRRFWRNARWWFTSPCLVQHARST